MQIDLVSVNRLAHIKYFFANKFISQPVGDWGIKLFGNTCSRLAQQLLEITRQKKKKKKFQNPTKVRDTLTMFCTKTEWAH